MILVLTAGVMGAYARVLVTADPMPPGKAPAAATGHASRSGPAPSPARTPTPTPTSEVR